MYLSRLLYYSVNRVQNQGGNLQQELKEIMLASQRNNPPLGVSGALIFNYNYFAQVLEGDRKVITHVFNKSTQDSRHSDIVLLETRPIQERMFVTWNMAFVGAAVTENELRRFGSSSEFRPEKMTAESLLGFVQEVVDVNANDNVLVSKVS